MGDTAVLGSSGAYTTFSYGDTALRFRAPKCLRGYTEVKEWDNGYLVVTADYGKNGQVEEYIDVTSVLHDLLFDAEAFLKPIKRVVLQDA